MALHTPVGDKSYLKEADFQNEFSASSLYVSNETPPSDRLPLQALDSMALHNPGANDDFWLSPASQPVAETTEWSQRPFPQNRLDMNEKGMELLAFPYNEPANGDSSLRLQAVRETSSWPSQGLSWSVQHEGSSDSNNVQHLQDFPSSGQDNIYLQQNTARLHEPYGARVEKVREFKSAGGGRRIYKAPDQDEDGPVAFELRPQPFKVLPVQPTGVLTYTDSSLWLAYEQGFLVWDILTAFRSSCDGRDNIKGDEDAAAYSQLKHGFSTTCLFADSANHLIWSGHKDGKMRAWSIVLEHDGENAANRNTAIFTWQAHQAPVLAIVVSSYGELWTGSESGSLRVWPQSALAQAFSSSKDSRLVAASFLATSYIDLKARGLASGASSLATIDMRFLIAEQSQCRVWSGGSHLLALWDSRTKELLKVFGSSADPEFLSPNVSPVRDIERGEEVRVNATKALRKEKSQGALSFFQRSRNAVMGAADAVLRAAVGQSIDDSKKMEALVSVSDGNVWAGYANGRLGQYDSSGYLIADHHHSYVAVRCMYAFGNRIFIGYADGVVHALAMTSGKLLGAWRAHRSSIARLAVCNNHLFTLADSGCLRGWFVTSSSAFDKALHHIMKAKESTYLRQENLKVLASTWNVGQEKASFKSLTSWLQKGSIEASIVAVGLQEVEMGAGALAMAAAKETVGLAGSVNGQWWLDSIEDVLNEKKPFSRVGSRQLAGLLIGIWVTKGLLPYIGGVDVSAVACGFGRAFGNKGAVAVKMMVFRRTVCVVNCHFAAHMDGVAKRNADFDHIYRKMSFAVQIVRGNSFWQEVSSLEQADISLEKDHDSGDSNVNMSELSEADLLIWVGDFNYRLTDVSYTEAVSLARDSNWEELIKKDQLRLEMKAGRVFQGMREAYIMFQPTYKFDKGSTELDYDSSDKRRVPAWCDRVLYRDSFDSNEAQKLGCSRPIAASASCYEACMEAIESDHKPVSCLLDVQVAVINEAARRWEYGRFLRTDAEALALQKRINNVPQTAVHTNNVLLVNRTKFILKISNNSTEEMALFSIQSEGEPLALTLNNQVIEQREGACTSSTGLPLWLQVLPSSGVIHPQQTVEVALHCGLMEDGFSSKRSSASRHHRTASGSSCFQRAFWRKVWVDDFPVSLGYILPGVALTLSLRRRLEGQPIHL
ncbi:hypothetical protein GOP47_0017364 [Adiantum capillus-veneris]|uniref:Inositol polyphosphate-related phosphatase domain-containing protein n=1 Tax=Adiantum capillus-veneris TaxID=13818 RepID=A0A9D4ZBP2_ADICA|nr:hypothetical protein GOP47_0017364 [Adiantum capillus-veneris]